MTIWRPIETAPKDGKKILVAYTYLDHQYVDTAWWDKVYRRWFHDFAFGTKTHWTPMPEPPSHSLPQQEKDDK